MDMIAFPKLHPDGLPGITIYAIVCDLSTAILAQSAVSQPHLIHCDVRVSTIMTGALAHLVHQDSVVCTLSDAVSAV